MDVIKNITKIDENTVEITIEDSTRFNKVVLDKKKAEYEKELQKINDMLDVFKTQ